MGVRRYGRYLAWVALLWGMPGVLSAQATVVQISGVVSDPQGSVIPGAAVKAVQTATGFVRTTTSGADGRYILPNLPVGPYQLEVSSEGFKTYVQRGIVLEVSTNPVVNVALELGAVSQAIEVTANATMTETQQTAVSQVINQQRILELPLNGRQATELVLLSGMAVPRGTVRYSGAKRSMSATLLCRGWWDTLGWQYANWDSVAAIRYTTSAGIEQAVGSAAANQRAMQQVTVGSQAINILQIALTIRKQGTPADNLTVGLYELDGSGNPTGGALASATLAGGSVPGARTRTVFVMSSEVERGAATQFAIQVSRSGAVDAANYFVVEVNTALGYTGGAFKLYNGAWVARVPNADMLFEVLVDNNVESTTQVRELVDVYGEFLTGVDVAQASGVYLPSYRDGDTTTLAEVKALLESGGANGRRLLASVDTYRRLSVYEEPDPATIRYAMNSDGVVLEGQQHIVPYLPPVGEWVQLVDVIPASVDITMLIDPTVQFIEGATWSAESPDVPQYQFRGQPSIEDMFKVRR